jgi:putative selenate reductase molybdopterin-binding subunit
MKITIRINGNEETWKIKPGESLLDSLRHHGYFSVKFGGCSQGECGACAILLDGETVNSCSMLAAQADGHSIETNESIGEHPEQGWRENTGLHVIQEAFVATGAIQCGYCTPAMVLAAKSLLSGNRSPSEDQVREALSGVLCRCTGYLKPVQAVLRAAAILRGEAVEPIQGRCDPVPAEWIGGSVGKEETPEMVTGTVGHPKTSVDILPQIKTTPETESLCTVGQPEPKVDSAKLVLGKPAFTDDFEIRDMLYAKVLYSPVAHAWIKNIDISKALNLPGVASILTWKDLPRVVYSTAGQSDPMPGPLDAFSLDKKVRFVGDRVAFVAAESVEIAEQALDLIEVEYEEIPAILDSREAMKDGAVVIHDEPEFVDFAESNAQRNLAAELRIDIGDVEKGFAEADRIFEAEYEVPKVQHAHIEPHITITYWDEDDRLIVRTSTQVPFHVRRILAPILELPMKRIRVIKPRIGGGFGGKQEILIEDVAAHLTIATKRPVRFEYTREEEFIAARARHPARIRLKTGVKIDGTITANEMYCLTDTGAYGCHAMTVTGNTGHKSMALYVGDGKYREAPNIRFYADIVYTNHMPAGAFRGYGGPQGFWAVERHMEKIARDLGLDSLEFRLKNALRSGELQPFSTAWSEGREPAPEIIHTVGLVECVNQAKAAIGWDQKYRNNEWHKVPGKPHLRRGIGVAFALHGTAIAYLDMGGASIKMNDDGSFNLLIGATDLGTGSDTVLAQMAAEVLGVKVEDMIVYSSDTDFTPFDKGAYASSTTYISGGAVVEAAKKVAERIRIRAASLLNARSDSNEVVESEQIVLHNCKAQAPDGRHVTMAEVALASLHHANQEQIMGVASFVSDSSPPPFGAQFAEITMDIETGQIVVDKLIMAVDGGVIVNPLTASGQIEGGMAQALGYGVCEEMTYDEKGSPIERDLNDYHIFRANEMPEMETIFVETFEPTHHFGVKAVGEIPLDGAAPAIGNALLDACGVQIDKAPITPEPVWRALRAQD